MIERLARRAGGFASTTALRWLGAAGDSVAELDLPLTKAPTATERARAPLAKGAVAGALVLISSNKLVRGEVAKGLRKITEALRTDASSPGASGRSDAHATARSNGARSNGAGTNGARSNGARNGSLSEKTRAELYEMAKKKDVSGRSTMSKHELVKALGGA